MAASQHHQFDCRGWYDNSEQSTEAAFRRKGRDEDDDEQRDGEHEIPVSLQWLGRCEGMLSTTDPDKWKDQEYNRPISLAEATEFTTHITTWKRDTRHVSSVHKKTVHESYLRIIAMASMARPLLSDLLIELKNRPDHWMVALKAIAGEDPASKSQSFNEAVLAWIEWGTNKGLI